MDKILLCQWLLLPLGQESVSWTFFVLHYRDQPGPGNKELPAGNSEQGIAGKELQARDCE